LIVVLPPSLLLYGPLIGGFDRDSTIHPLRDGYRDSHDVQEAVEALGQIDELLSFHRYAKAFGSAAVLPGLLESDLPTVPQSCLPALASILPHGIVSRITLRLDLRIDIRADYSPPRVLDFMLLIFMAGAESWV